mmetsp:Transcript_11224/g.29932  ORF Transcript_11224/g.29932 Transcript_11224/m.29932 type:complete len:312 (-) Transcript_11224:4595-5530(-)
MHWWRWRGRRRSTGDWLQQNCALAVPKRRKTNDPVLFCAHAQAGNAVGCFGSRWSQSLEAFANFQRSKVLRGCHLDAVLEGCGDNASVQRRPYRRRFGGHGKPAFAAVDQAPALHAVRPQPGLGLRPIQNLKQLPGLNCADGGAAGLHLSLQRRALLAHVQFVVGRGVRRALVALDRDPSLGDGRLGLDADKAPFLVCLLLPKGLDGLPHFKFADGLAFGNVEGRRDRDALLAHQLLRWLEKADAGSVFERDPTCVAVLFGLPLDALSLQCRLAAWALQRLEDFADFDAPDFGATRLERAVQRQGFVAAVI